MKSEFQEPDGFSAQTWDAEKGFRARPAPPEPGTAAAFAFERLSRWSVAKGEARYPHRRFPMVPSWYFEEYSRRQVAQLFNIKPPEFWNSLTFEKLREAAPLLKTEWTMDQEEIEPEHGKDLANYLTSIADSVIRDAAEHARQQKPQETQETAQSAEHSKRMSPLGRDLEKQEDILARSDVSSGDKVRDSIANYLIPTKRLSKENSGWTDCARSQSCAITVQSLVRCWRLAVGALGSSPGQLQVANGCSLPHARPRARAPLCLLSGPRGIDLAGQGKLAHGKVFQWKGKKHFACSSLGWRSERIKRKTAVRFACRILQEEASLANL